MDFFNGINISLQDIQNDLQEQVQYIQSNNKQNNDKIQNRINQDKELIDLKKNPQDYQLWDKETIANYSWAKYKKTHNEKWFELMNIAQVGTYESEWLVAPAYMIKSHVLLNLAHKRYPHLPLSTDDTNSANIDALFNNLMDFNKFSKQQNKELKDTEQRIKNKQ